MALSAARPTSMTPAIYEGTTPVEQPKTAEEGYHFTEDMTDKAIAWVQQQKALMADKPFFMYFAPGACHAPHHVPKEWADKYKGKFDQGWDKLRDEILARQKNLGVVPLNSDLTARPKEIEAWDEVDPKMKPVLAREMEVFAGFMEHTDHHVGRLINTLADLQILDDTLIYVIIGDNGSSAEGTPNGTFNEMLMLNGIRWCRNPGIPEGAARQVWQPGGIQPLCRGLGARPGHGHTSGPSRWHRTGVARAMGRSSTGPKALRRKERFVRNSPM